MLSKEENDNILRVEMEKLRNEIIEVYNNSGKRVTGQFEEGLLIEYQPNKANLSGFSYLGGRPAGGKMPPIQAIEKWIRDKGISAIEKKISVSSLAYLIARKIGREGTKKENNLAIYSQVVTPERIDEILGKINSLNVSKFIADIESYITKAFNGFQ